MKFIQPANVLVILTSLILFSWGHFYFTNFFQFAEPAIPGISFQIIEKDGFLKTSILFSLTLALMPIALLITWRLGAIAASMIRALSIIVVILFCAVAVFLRHQAVKIYFIRVVKPVVASNNAANVIYPIDPVRFVYYMFAGLLLGCIISFFLFRQKETKA